MSKKQVAIVIPFYKPQLTAYEKLAIQQCFKILGSYPIIAVKPAEMELPVDVESHTLLETKDFDPAYFSGIAGYNRLMLSAEFYNALDGFEYILIYQPDAFVFKDELAYWCNKGYDYIGAPWVRQKYHTNKIKSVLLYIQQQVSTRFDLKKSGAPNKYQFECKVGNGGFSLRRVSKFKELALTQRSKIEEYLGKNAHQYNEDAFWSIEVNRKKKILNIPDWRTGLKFAFENHLDNCLKYNAEQLPFGCHAWDKHAEFWRPIFKGQGIDI